MKLMICGKGGSGKSTITALLAKALADQGQKVLVVDADESNIGLYQMLGLSMPQTLMQSFGGKKGFNARLKAAGAGLGGGPPVFANGLSLDNLPESCVASAGNVQVVSTGKIHHFGEGCACPMGNLFRAFLGALNLTSRDLVIVDTTAGLEHFGRRLESQVDHILCVVAPSFESVTLAQRMTDLAQEAALPLSLVLNSMTPDIIPEIENALEGMDILGAIPQSPEIFMNTLKGRALDVHLPEITALAQAIDALAGDYDNTPNYQ